MLDAGYRLRALFRFARVVTVYHFDALQEAI